jgi:hypothetical protein
MQRLRLAQQGHRIVVLAKIEAYNQRRSQQHHNDRQ